MEEIWKDIPGYEGLYQVSSLGNIKSCQKILKYRNGKNVHRKETIMSLNKSFGQYLTVGLSKNNKRKLYNVHYLVAITFIDNPNNLPCINHKDEDKFNNSVNNLEWCTKAYNNTYGGKIERMRIKKKKSILQKDRKGNVVKEWDSIKSAAEALGINGTQISRYARGVIRGLYKGFYWEYKTPQVYKERKGKRIGKFDLDGNLIATFDSIMEASKSATITSFTISNCVNGHTQTAGGYYWKQL